MALPVYRQRGIMYADLPRVETASLKEGARGFETINRRLDQLSSFVEREGTKQAKEQALAYAAQNPVTQEQIDEAVASKGEGKSWLSALTGGNVYDETLQAAQGSMLANQLSIEAAKKFRELQVQAENNQIGFDDAQTEIQDIIDGYATTISAFSPEASLKARASMATAGNGVLKEVAQKQSKILAAAQAAKMENDMYEFSRIAEDEFARGDSWNPTSQTYIRAEDRIQTLFTPLSEQALALGQEGKVPLLYKRLRESRINGVTKGLLDDRFAANHTQAYQKIINGDLGEYESSWAMMSDDERDKVVDKFLKEVSERRSVAERAEKEREDTLKKESIMLQNEAIDAPRSRQIEILSKLQDNNEQLGTNFTPINFLKSIDQNKLQKGLDNERLMFQLRDAISDGVLDSNTIEYLAVNGEIDWDQASALQKKLDPQENREERRVLKLGRAMIKQLGFSTEDQREAISSMETQVYTRPDDMTLEQAMKLAVQEAEQSVANDRRQDAFDGILRQLKAVPEFSGLTDEELIDKANAIMAAQKAPESLPNKQKSLIQRYLKTWLR
jgi:hypothetical protein